MFNQLTPAETVRAIGLTARNVARGGEPSEFDRDQLMSAYSATRHLVPELRYYPAELRRFAADVVSAVGEAQLDGGEENSALVQGIVDTSDPALLGGVICELLDRLSRDDSPGARALRDRLHVLLRELADREVDLVAEALQ